MMGSIIPTSTLEHLSGPDIYYVQDSCHQWLPFCTNSVYPMTWSSWIPFVGMSLVSLNISPGFWEIVQNLIVLLVCEYVGQVQSLTSYLTIWHHLGKPYLSEKEPFMRTLITYHWAIWCQGPPYFFHHFLTVSISVFNL